VKLEDFNTAWIKYYQAAQNLAKKYEGHPRTEATLTAMQYGFQALHRDTIQLGYSFAFIYPRFSGFDQAGFELYVNPKSAC